MKNSVVIAEDNFLIREGHLEPLMEQHFTIVASVDNGLDAVAAVEAHRPTVVLLDVSLPGLRGFDAARKILALHSECKVLFVSNYADPTYVQAASEMGASGYVLKNRIDEELIPAIHAAVAGEFYRSTF